MKKPNRIKAVTGGILIDGTGFGPVEGATVLDVEAIKMVMKGGVVEVDR